MLAIPFMEFSAPAAERALDARPEAFRAFYEEALPRVYGYFLHRCGGSVPVAEDLTQETFLAAVGELKKGKRIDTPVAWIFGIARHKLLDHYRRQERLERPLVTLVVTGQPEEELRVTEGEDAREHAIAALANVAASQRAALVLCYVDGYSVAETARLLDRSVEAVESLLARGRQSFKRSYLEAAEQP
jgi:RNA polymerase sigma-70 factor (ECF subfamily)